MMWEALAKIAEFGALLITKLWPSKAEAKGEVKAKPRDIATAQRSAEAADREGKIASARAKK